jgi:hypothetical protein
MLARQSQDFRFQLAAEFIAQLDATGCHAHAFQLELPRMV